MTVSTPNRWDELPPILEIVAELTAIGRALGAVEYISAERPHGLANELRARVRSIDGAGGRGIGPRSRHEATLRRAWMTAQTLASILRDATYQFGLGDETVRPMLVRTIHQIGVLFDDIVWLEESCPRDLAAPRAPTETVSIAFL